MRGAAGFRLSLRNAKRKFARNKYLYMLVALPIVYLLVFKYFPMYGMQIAFRDFRVRSGIWGSAWVGLKHFHAYLKDPNFWMIAKNTIVLGFCQIIFCFPVPIVFALMVNELKSKRKQMLIQNISYLPHFISVVVVASMTVTFLSNDGLINQIIYSFGGTPHSFMQDPRWFRTVYILTDIWQTMGWSAIIYSAALTGVNMELYEAAVIDGANRWKQILHISIPAIMPTITILFIMRMGGILSVSFEKTLLLQNELTYEVSDVISTFVYRKGLNGAQYSYASAVDMFSTLVNLIFLAATNWICGRMNETSLW